MTRINLVDPAELADQHLFAEFREIKMVPMALRRSLLAAYKHAPNVAKAEQLVLSRIPYDFVLGAGHVSFFYNKGRYLRNRYRLIREELQVRGINYNQEAEFDPLMVFLKLGANFNCNWDPTEANLVVIRARIAEKIALKPKWYRWSKAIVYPQV